MKNRKTILIALLITVAPIAIIGSVVTWRYVVFQKAARLIRTNEPSAELFIERLHKNPLFPIDWSLTENLRSIPFAYDAYERIVGCTGCAGHWNTLFTVASRDGATNVLSRIIEMRQGNVGYHGDDGNLALREAIWGRNTNNIVLLIQAGADVNSMPDYTRSPLQNAIIGRASIDTIKLLVESGAKIDHTDPMGVTSLEWAKRMKYTNAVKYLVELAEAKTATE